MKNDDGSGYLLPYRTKQLAHESDAATAERTAKAPCAQRLHAVCTPPAELSEPEPLPF